MPKMWGTAKEATAILSEQAGRQVSEDYIRSLVRAGRVRRRKPDGRTNEYNLNDCRAYRVRGYRKDKSMQQDQDHLNIEIEQ